MDSKGSLQQVLELAEHLSTVDKVRLIERIAPKIESDLCNVQHVPRKSLRGLWRGPDITDEDLSEVRREMWGSFPREDI